MTERTEELLRRILDIPDTPSVMREIMAQAVKLDLRNHLLAVERGEIKL